ncbi:hypothetical protein ABIE26_000845 [Pedobacter africanus]|uniref:Uncharacterized protein n=1 Tax=Pedobacter africanus TaxID=151894 RepID=A0ACC6KTX1_9SPHI|nr:hypothetical protein [Pedobacter africanus]MDR6782667.1 hypothetical protein [Pedobacter africanus]
MTELNYFEAIIKVLEQGSYYWEPDMVAILHRTKTEMMEDGLNYLIEAGCDLYWEIKYGEKRCCALVVRAMKVEERMQGLPLNMEEMHEQDIIRALIGILNELCDWFRDLKHTDEYEF